MDAATFEKVRSRAAFELGQLLGPEHVRFVQLHEDEDSNSDRFFDFTVIVNETRKLDSHKLPDVFLILATILREHGESSLPSVSYVDQDEYYNVNEIE